MSGARPLQFWEAFLRELGVEVALPTLPPQELYALGRESLPTEAAHIQYLLGRVLELQRSDLILLPRPLPVAQDAWGEALDELLPRRISGLPALQLIPDDGAAALASAAELGQRLTHNPGLVRLALDRVRPLSAPLKEAMPRLNVASRPTVAVLGPPALLADPFLSGPLRERLDALELNGVFGTDLPASQVTERAERFGDAPAGQRWLNGTQGLLEGKSAVAGLLYVHPERDVAWQQALSRMARKARKPAAVQGIEPGQDHWTALDDLQRRLTAPTPAARARDAQPGSDEDTGSDA
ncbi:hypothetical protein GCM10008939_30290 [Deinococcus aquiradiocola]|uniref:Uncharacterized protein n=2 Tax=Deinococcus aquiradiocola TaxID=393059 RepID=A0A917PLR7_9DEIO|nr:hypothetical protein GCM10008939_30290 [Deinococcus aquiradiocola]